MSGIIGGIKINSKKYILENIREIKEYIKNNNLKNHELYYIHQLQKLEEDIMENGKEVN